MNIRKRFLIIALALGIAPALVAQKHDRPEPEDKISFLAKQLDLTKEQQAQLEKVRSETIPKKEALQAKIKPIKDELHTLLSSDFIDKPKIKSKMEEISKYKIELKLLWIDNRIKLNQLLTPEQKAKHKELMKKRHDEMKEKHDNWNKKHGSEDGDDE